MSQQAEEKKYPAPVSAKFAGITLLAALPFDVLAHLGPTGLLVGGFTSYVAWKHGPEVYDLVRDTLPFLPALEPSEKEKAENAGKKQGRSFWDRALGRYPDQVDQAQEDAQDEQEPGESDFVRNTPSTNEVPGVPRYGVDQIVRHIVRNRYKIYIGRSLTQELNPAILISFYRRHLKIIGASQMGKSSMAAALLEIILRTHDPALVLLAILDMEDMTGRLFSDDPHIVRVLKDGKLIPLHSRSREQVLEHLELIIEIMDYRYTMSKTEQARQPLLIVYLEEFIALKDYFKQRAASATGPAKEQAKRDYERLVFCIKEIARRGLKVQVQFLMCAQVDYRDDDLQEALINITSGMSFAVRVSAAQAAGFYQSELLSRNAKANKVGQAVAEMPDCKDLILAPEYDLEKKLLALEERENIHHSPARPSTEIRELPVNAVNVNAVNGVNALEKLVNASVNDSEYSPEPENNSPLFTPAEEVQVLLAYAEVLKSEKQVTRTGIRDLLGWDNKQYQRIIKPVCDKHHIAE
jgi:FtsK/SpoIIIE family